MKPDFSQPTILYGGSFDPLHNGHLHVAREALRAHPEVKQLIFVPAGHSPGKKPNLASGEQRFAWIRATVLPLGFQVWDHEVVKGGESYTVETLETAHAMGANRARLFWLLGADAYGSFPTWRKPEKIRALCRLLVVNRPGKKIPLLDPEDLFLEIPPHPASSSALRTRLQSGDPCQDWLPSTVKAALDKLLPDKNPYVRTKS